jgi:hypothetical protein
MTVLYAAAGPKLLCEELLVFREPIVRRLTASSTKGQFCSQIHGRRPSAYRSIAHAPLQCSEGQRSAITGSFLYDQCEGRFEFRRGPICTHLLLADENNRATPKNAIGTD